MLDDHGWQELCSKLAREHIPEKRLALLAEMEQAAREEQTFLKDQLRPRLENYLRLVQTRVRGASGK